MADENTQTIAPEDATQAQPEATSTPAPETTPAPAPAPTPAPAPQPHDPYLVLQAREFGIPAEEVTAMSGAELSRAVYLLNKQQNTLRAQIAQPKPAEQPKPVEPEFTLPADLKAKLGDFDPAIVQAVEFAARAGVDRAKKAEQELAVVRQQVAGQSFAQQVNAAMTPIPPAQRDMVMAKLAQLEQSGELPPNTPPHIAVPLAHKALLQAFGVQPAAASPPAPTPSARPTNRINGVDGSTRSLKEELIDLYDSKRQEWDDEDDAKAVRNGVFKP